MSRRNDNPIQRFLVNPTRKTAIDAACARCFGCTKDHLESGYRDDIRACSDSSCPLHDFRPFKGDPVPQVKESLNRANLCSVSGKTPLKNTFSGVVLG
jgi:hypothetical protein